MEEILDDLDIAMTVKVPKLIEELVKVLTALAADKALLNRLIHSFKGRMELLREAKGKRLRKLN